jgi:hypothetical protein
LPAGFLLATFVGLEAAILICVIGVALAIAWSSWKLVRGVEKLKRMKSDG